MLGVMGFLMMPWSLALGQAVGSVVINEVAWAGSPGAGNDEWIELYNGSGAAVDLTGWTIVDDGATTYALSGMIAAGGYFVIEDSEAAVQPLVADALVNVSLANTGDSLVLKDGTGATMDAVNSGGGAWFAGDAASAATMERIDVFGSGDSAANWASSNGSGSAQVGSGGSLIVGTPGMVNSVAAASGPGLPQVVLTFLDEPQVGSLVRVAAHVEGADDLFSYGFALQYDAEVLDFVSASGSDFLNGGGSVATSFQSSLENDEEGVLLVAEARTMDVKSGVDGDGLLFEMVFEVVGGATATAGPSEGQASVLAFGSDSFMADVEGDVETDFVDGIFTPVAVGSGGGGSVGAVMNLTVAQAAARYELQLSWDGAAGAEGYRVYRRDVHGVMRLLGETAELAFVDKDAVSGGGFLVPQTGYEYRVEAFSADVSGEAGMGTGMETRGLKGDNDRSDRVDGRDLDNLARHFGQNDVDVGFDALVDTTYDGMVDGSDLIDLGASFGLTYGG